MMNILVFQVYAWIRVLNLKEDLNHWKREKAYLYSSKMFLDEKLVIPVQRSFKDRDQMKCLRYGN